MASYKTAQRSLYALAAEQGGYFTARQALAVGYAYPEQHYHVAHGNWERVARAVFRLGDFPRPERDDLVVLSLLSHDRSSHPQAVFSHETALALHDLSDVNPARLHLTVPPGFRRQLQAHTMVHRGLVPPEEWEEHDGYRITTPLRTLTDVAASRASWTYLETAVRDALLRGLVRRRQLLAADLSQEAHARMVEAVDAAEQKAGA
jgi:predicted transcriptional regulator of viral defense system